MKSKPSHNQVDNSGDMAYLIRQSNLVEGIDDVAEDKQSLKAWNWLVKQDAIVPSVILTLHYKITKNQLPKSEAGALRKIQVYVGNHVPPSHLWLDQLIYDWCMNVNYTELAKQPKQAHVEFEKIHPFVDGNGRTGRMLMWLQELKLGKQPTPILLNERQAYYEWFRADTKGNDLALESQLIPTQTHTKSATKSTNDKEEQ